jgi:hypothetical protein
MSPTRWVLPRALSFTMLAAAFGPASAWAQLYEPAVRSLDLASAVVARSPRLLGMGALSITVPDRNTQINLWDLGGLPAGLVFDDTTSTLDFRPGTGSLSGVHTIEDGRERQDLAARSTAAQFEGVYRSRQSGAVFGVTGDFSGLQWDRPYSTDVEVRQGLTHPEATAILGGKLPRFFHGHLNWALSARFRNEHLEEQYREIVRNASGDYIDQAGGQLTPPSEFTPTDMSVETNALGVSTAYSIGTSARVGVGIERSTDKYKALNEQSRSTSEVQEERPYWTGQATIAGRIGPTFEYGVTGRGRVSDSEADWRFSASAGTGGLPLSGRGNLLTREESSSEMRARLRWTPSKVSLAASLVTAAHEIILNPPNANDATSFNRFLNLTFNRDGTDSLAYPDSVIHEENRRWAVAYGGGASYKLDKGIVGVEYHWARDIHGSTRTGEGPKRVAWDIRTGVERVLGPQMSARAGYAYRQVDEDEFTANNEWLAHAFSFGAGYAPVNSSWSLEFGYQFELRGEEYESAGDDRQTRQNMAMQIHWRF